MAKVRTVTRQVISVARQQHRCYSAPTDGSIPAAKAKYVPSEGTYPKGFLVGSAHAGVKPSNTRFNDLALFASEKLCNAAGVFTVNAFKAAPVQVSRRVLHNGSGKGVRGVVINSGCANAVTGTGGIEDAIDMATKIDVCFPEETSAPPMVPKRKDNPGIDPDSPLKTDKRMRENRTLVMSTGVIGQRLPIDRIKSKIPDLYSSLGSSHDHWLGAAKAICTTDTFPKLISRSFTLPSSPDTEYHIAGTTKGAGMIHPNMATLLSVICTDAKVESEALKFLLRSATSTSFNSISIDGDTSTNDTVNLFANGAACPDGIAAITLENAAVESNQLPDLSTQSDDYKAFHTVLCSFMADLAQLVVRDGEGATKFVTIRIQGASDNTAAHQIANSIARSPLVKTALYGKDANWGRILCAIGYSHARTSVVPRFTSVSFIPSDGSQELKLLSRGEPENVDEARAKEILEMEDLEILVKLSDGMDKSNHRQGFATMWTCDFSHEYVTINGDYRT